MDLAHTLGQPESTSCLDVGAGTGRNTLALARAGFRTDALEPSPALADQLEVAIRREGVSSRVIRTDFLAGRLQLPRTRYRLVVLSGVCPHFRDVEMLARLFRRLAGVLEPGGSPCSIYFSPSMGTPPTRSWSRYPRSRGRERSPART